MRPINKFVTTPTTTMIVNMQQTQKRKKKMNFRVRWRHTLNRGTITRGFVSSDEAGGKLERECCRRTQPAPPLSPLGLEGGG